MNRGLRHAIPTLSRHIRHGHTPPHEMYNNPRRGRAAGLTALAAGQATFWGITSTLTSQIAEPLFSPVYTYAGFALSAAFVALISSYLRRSVAHVALVDGPCLVVTPHAVAGLRASPVLVPAAHLVAGVRKDDAGERYWTLGVKTSEQKRPFYYIIDTNHGVVDRRALAAAVRGGHHLLAFSHKRDAEMMKQRWQIWKDNL